MVTDAQKRRALAQSLNGAIANMSAAERRLADAEERVDSTYAVVVDVKARHEDVMTELRAGYNIAASKTLDIGSSADERLDAIDRVNATIELMVTQIETARADVREQEKKYHSAKAEKGTALQQLNMRRDEVTSLRERLTKELVLADQPPL